ncbi:MAG: AIR synthase related protein, partial [Limnothrix sp.]
LDVPTIASKKWIYRQYDHQVQNNTVIFPGGADAAVVRVRPVNGKPDASTIGVAACTDCNPRYVYLNPLEGAKAAVAEAARNLSCVGAEPLAITNNLNFGSPEKAIGYWQLANSCKGISEACRELDTPVTGGNVSLYNETLDSDGKPTPIYPTPVIGMVGRVEDITKVCGLAFQNVGDRIYLLGTQATTTLGGSEYLNTIHNTVGGIPPQVDFAIEKAVQKTVRTAITEGLLSSAHDLAEGGLAVAIAESCIGQGLGASVTIETTGRLDETLFGETCGKIVVSVSAENQTAWEAHLNANIADNWQQIGEVQDSGDLVITSGNATLIDVSIGAMTESWSQAIARRLHP